MVREEHPAVTALPPAVRKQVEQLADAPPALLHQVSKSRRSRRLSALPSAAAATKTATTTTTTTTTTPSSSTTASSTSDARLSNAIREVEDLFAPLDDDDNTLPSSTAGTASDTDMHENAFADEDEALNYLLGELRCGAATSSEAPSAEEALDALLAELSAERKS